MRAPLRAPRVASRPPLRSRAPLGSPPPAAQWGPLCGALCGLPRAGGKQGGAALPLSLGAEQRWVMEEPLIFWL